MKLKWKFNWKEMKRWKKIALISLLIFVLFQIPFIYRRARLGHLYSRIQQLDSQRVRDPAESPYVDYKGVIHVHSSLGGHSFGSFVEIAEAAKMNGLNFVVMTEHPSALLDTSAATFEGRARRGAVR
jgi:hypothetical protein